MRCSHGLPLEVKCTSCFAEAMSKVMAYTPMPTCRKTKPATKTPKLKVKTGFGK